MKSKKITIGAIAASVVILAVIGALFATSPGGKAEAERQLLFWNQEIYVCTWEDVSEMVAYENAISEYDSPYIGVIESTVGESETPDQELQSNFGYVGSEVIFNGSGIAVNMDGKWIQFLQEGSDLFGTTGIDHLRSRLINSVIYSSDGNLYFTIPEGEHDWHIRISGREEAEDSGGMSVRSVQYLEERTAADDWKGGETYSFLVDAAVTELYMEVSIDGNTMILNLTDWLSMIYFQF